MKFKAYFLGEKISKCPLLKRDSLHEISKPVFCFLDEAILMSTHNIQFHDKVRKFPQIFVFLV